MSEEMAVSDNTTGDEAKVSNDEATTATVAEPEEAAVEAPIEPVVPVVEEPPALAEENPIPELEVELKIEKKTEVKKEPESDELDVPLETPEADLDIKKEEDDVKDEIETFEHNIEDDITRGIKRRASSAFSDTGDEEFKGFDEMKLEVKAADYCRILERLEAEVTAASKDLVPLRTVMATPPVPGRASKRPRKDTDGSRPSSALSSRSDGDGATDEPSERNNLKNIKEKKRTCLKHTDEILEQATHTNKQGSREPFPNTTVQDQLLDKPKEQPQEVGPEFILGIDGEHKVVHWIKELAQCGFAVSKDVLLKSVAILIQEIGKENEFSEWRPGEIWYQSFLRRYPEISIVCESEGISKTSELPRESLIRKWFTDLESFLKEKGLTDIMKDPERVFNGDETRFSVSKSGKILDPEAFEMVSRKNEKILTVFIMMTASGTVCPPMLICPCIMPPRAFTENMPGDWLIGRNKLGRMSKEILYEYIANGFNKWLVKNNVKKPVIVFLDGQKSQRHFSMPLSKICEEYGIILYALPPNAAHIMQPAEISVFRPLKQEWKQTVRNWQAKPENLNVTVTKINFPKVVKETLDTGTTLSVKNGFKKCGLFPFDVEAVDFSKCVDFQDRSNERSESSSGLTKKDFEIALNVIGLVKDRLSKRGIDSDIVSNEIKLAILSYNKCGQSTEVLNFNYGTTRKTNVDT